MGTAIRGANDSGVVAGRDGILRIDNGYLEQALGSAAVLRHPTLAAIVGLEDQAVLTSDPSAFAIGRKANRVQIAILKQRSAGPLLQRAQIPGFALVAGDHQSGLRTSYIDIAVRPDRDTEQAEPRGNGSNAFAFHRSAGRCACCEHQKTRSEQGQTPESS